MVCDEQASAKAEKRKWSVIESALDKWSVIETVLNNLLVISPHESSWGMPESEKFVSFLKKEDIRSLQLTSHKMKRLVVTKNSTEENKVYVLRSERCNRFSCNCGKNYCGMRMFTKKDKLEAWREVYALNTDFCMPFGESPCACCACECEDSEHREWCGSYNGDYQKWEKYCEEMIDEHGY